MDCLVLPQLSIRRPLPMTPVRLSVLFFTIVALAGCTSDGAPKTEPSFYRSLAQPDAQLDAEAAASMITGYRANNSLGAVTIDPELMRLAEAKAAAMAKRDKIDRSAGKPFAAKLKAAGFDPKIAAENVGAGYHTLAEAFSGWRDSPPHRKTMLLAGATRMGIAAVYAPTSKYKVYWALILAEPDDKKG
jgi:uncharacterized protein YkwD